MTVKQVGPWRCLSSEVVYENPWISVRHESVITPGNTEGIYGVVHFKGTAVGVLPIDDEGNTWLVSQTRYTLEAMSLEIPEGGAPKGESTELCAHRELREEVGLTATDMQHLMTLHLSNSVTDERCEVYVAKGLSVVSSEPEASEDITIHKMPFREALAKTFNGEITDAISVAAIQRYALQLQMDKS